MSASASVSVVTNIAGQTSAVQITRSGDGVGQWTPTVAPGSAGSLNNSTGVISGLPTGHGITTSNKVDVFWSGGRRYNMTVTAASANQITVTPASGGGDTLPVGSASAIVVCTHAVVNASFDPDDMAVLVVSTTKRASVVFVDSGGVKLTDLDLAAGEFCLWLSNSGITRPMSGNPVAAIWVGNGDAAAETTVTISVLYDATP